VAKFTPAALVNCQVKVTWEPALTGEGVADEDTTTGGVVADATVEGLRAKTPVRHAVKSRA
jgi:hypothetical protein